MQSKMFSFKWFSFLITSCLLLNQIKCNDEEVVSVRLNTGVINGRIETSVDDKRINVFKGIPFAEPPIGDLRFKKPQPLREWPKTLDAFEWPSTCHQADIMPGLFDSFYNKNFSEDCLYLNIWSPENALKSDKLLPVIFYIHGGGLTHGTGAWKPVDMRVLSTEGNIVSVSINYRLNSLGFLYSGRDDAPGNVGLLDQALALEWVNDNIRYFGGDPKQITIMGMSAGSWSVSLHLLSPITRNLFRNAILQSGAYVDYLIGGESKDHKGLWLKMAESAGCGSSDGAEEVSTEAVECLRKLDAKTLVDLSFKFSITSVPSGMFPLVVIDGHFLPESPTKMLRSGDFKQDTNILFSTAADEGSGTILGFAVPEINSREFTFKEAQDKFVELSPRLSKKYNINGKDVAKVYLNGLSDDSDSGSFKRMMGIASGDLILGCPSILFAKEFFRNSHFKNNVYQYYWNTKASKSFFPMMDWWGPSHGEDAPIAHGMPLLNQDEYVNDDRELSKQMIKFVTNFVKYGKPGKIDGTKWPKYFHIDDHIIAPYYEITSSDKSDTNFGIGLKITECEYLWQKYLL